MQHHSCVISVGPTDTIYTMKAYIHICDSAAEHVIYSGILTTMVRGSAEKHVKHLIKWNVWFHVF